MISVTLWRHWTRSWSIVSTCMTKCKSISASNPRWTIRWYRASGHLSWLSKTLTIRSGRSSMRRWRWLRILSATLTKRKRKCSMTTWCKCRMLTRLSTSNRIISCLYSSLKTFLNFLLQSACTRNCCRTWLSLSSTISSMWTSCSHAW